MAMLTARWGRDQDITYNDPELYWEDGRPANCAEYRAHRMDTHALIQTEDGMELRMYPGVVADVRYDGYQRLWFVVPEGGEPISLDIANPEATDLDIRAALYQLQPVYKVRIHR